MTGIEHIVALQFLQENASLRSPAGACTAPHLMYRSKATGCSATRPVLTMVQATMEQKAMWMQVSVKGKGKPPNSGSRMYLFMRMTLADKHIHNSMYLPMVIGDVTVSTLPEACVNQCDRCMPLHAHP